MDVKGPRYLIRLVPSDLRWPVLFGRKKLAVTNTPALLNLLDAPWGSDPAFNIIWSGFHQMRRYLACRPGEEGRMYQFLDHASPGSPRHRPIHLLLSSALDVGFAWDSEHDGWILAMPSASAHDGWVCAALSQFYLISLARHCRC